MRTVWNWFAFFLNDPSFHVILGIHMAVLWFVRLFQCAVIQTWFGILLQDNAASLKFESTRFLCRWFTTESSVHTNNPYCLHCANSITALSSKICSCFVVGLEGSFNFLSFTPLRIFLILVLLATLLLLCASRPVQYCTNLVGASVSLVGTRDR